MIKNNNIIKDTLSSDKLINKTFFKKRKGCPLLNVKLSDIDYKNPDLLIKFISEGGRILPSRITNVSSKKQRKLKKAIKIARILALIPFVFQI